MTRPTFPERFYGGALVGLTEFLRRLKDGEDARELLTPEFADFLYGYIESVDSTNILADKIYIDCPQTGGAMRIRDAWIFIGNAAAFASSIGMFGGALSTKPVQHTSSSSKRIIQLPFVSIVGGSSTQIDVTLEAEEGLQLAVDVAIKGDFKYGFRGDEMSEERTTVVRFMSQVFEPKKCSTTQERNRRIFSIRNSIRWSIADIDYVWSQDNFHRLK